MIYVTHQTGFSSNIAFLSLNLNNVMAHNKDGSVVPTSYTAEDIVKFIAGGDWKQITRAQADKLTQKPFQTGEIYAWREPKGEKAVIVERADGKYEMGGRGNKVALLYGGMGKSRDDMQNYLNENNYILVGKVADLV